jgi:hypothetical protein
MKKNIVWGGMSVMTAMLLMIGCSNPNVPTLMRVDPMAEFAAAHAHQVCVLVSGWSSETDYYSYPALIDAKDYRDAMKVLPISACDPRE